jgi:hypothetical protein
MKVANVSDEPVGKDETRWLRRLGKSITAEAVVDPNSSRNTDLELGYDTRLL